ncbi:hypothetical protein GCM10017744_029900 [Streptomyces antimycoticus]
MPASGRPRARGAGASGRPLHVGCIPMDGCAAAPGFASGDAVRIGLGYGGTRSRMSAQRMSERKEPRP